MANVEQKMPVHNLKKAIEMAEAYYHADTPVYFWGPPGVGKSQGLAQLARKLRIGFGTSGLVASCLKTCTVSPCRTLKSRWLSG